MMVDLVNGNKSAIIVPILKFYYVTLCDTIFYIWSQYRLYEHYRLMRERFRELH